MAKKRFTKPDDLVSGLDDRAPAQPRGVRGQPARSRSKSFPEPPPADARDIAVATGDKTMAGQFKRKQILIPPAQLEYIRRKARELRLSQAELFRWLIDYGLMALDQDVEPEIEVVDVRGETLKSHWTSH
jgi:hypothetical protein